MGTKDSICCFIGVTIQSNLKMDDGFARDVEVRREQKSEGGINGHLYCIVKTVGSILNSSINCFLNGPSIIG